MAANELIGGLKKSTSPALQPDLLDQVNKLNGRIRSFERSIAELRSLVRFHEEHTTRHEKELKTKQKELSDTLHTLEDNIHELQHQLTITVRELGLTAKKEDVDVIKRMMDIIKPTRFITEERAEKLIKDILQEQGLLPK